MRKLFFLLFALSTLILTFSLEAQENTLDSMSLNGVTGIYVVPTARIGFPDDNFGFNGGYHTNIFKPKGGDLKPNHLIQTNFSLFKMVELAGTFDLKPDPLHHDLLFGVKFQFPFTPIPVAVGSNFQYTGMGDANIWALQFYGAVTYKADLFGWPADTTLVMGYTFIKDESHSNIDFGVGFDMIIFPEQLRNFLHALIDYANFSYSVSPWGADAWARGVFNTGLRVDLSQIPALNKFTFAVDIFLADAFDSSNSFGSGRSFGTGVTFGMSF